MPVSVELRPHPDTAGPAGVRLTVAVAREADGALVLSYRLAGDLAALAIPAPAAPERRDGLWRHTCCEAFVMAGDGPAYREFNFAPSGNWASYAFTAYRAGGRDLAMPAPDIACRTHADGFELSAHLPGIALPGGRLRLGLSTVVEDAAGALSYWALGHGPGRPDFHHPDTFALELP